MRKLNLVFLAILLTTVAVLGGGMHIVHGVQVRRNALALLDRARRAESGNDLEKAQQALRQYLNFRREDGPAWQSYARVVEQKDADHRNRERVFLIHEEALRYNAGDTRLERKCADLALELQRYGDAQRHLKNLFDSAKSNPQAQPTAVELAELQDLLGRCDLGLTRYEDAEKWFNKALENDPSRVACYDRLARLRRTELRRIEAANGTIAEMVAKNPTAGLAFIYRWRYSQEFLNGPDVNDLQKALELAPDDPEVLFTAAVVSEQKQDAASARIYFERGLKLDPKHANFALGLARLEMREGHLDRAEAVLRQAFEATHSIDAAFSLAENLILQGKIDGKDQAGDYINLLRKIGLGDTLVPFLEARILVQQKKWTQAIPRLETARALLGSSPRLIAVVDLLLVECYGHMGSDEQRLEALGRVAEGQQSPESARIEFVQALARSGKLDRAVNALLPLVRHKPELRLELARLLLQRTIRQPKERRNWQEVEQSLKESEKALPQAVEPIVLMRLDLLAAQDRLDDARSLLSTSLAKDPRNLRYRLALARLTQRQGQGSAALQLIDQAEKDLGPSLDIQLARLGYWGHEGGDQAKAAVAKMASMRGKVPAGERPALLDRLGVVENRLGQLDLARLYWRELAALQAENLGIRLRLFDLAVRAGDHPDATGLADEIRKIEGDNGTSWRFARAALLIDGVRRGASQSLDEARGLAAEISKRRPEWAGGCALSGELAELAGSTDQAISHYLRAVELGDAQPSLVRRLVGLLTERRRFDEIDHVTHLLRDQGNALDEVTIVKALDAIRKQEFEMAITLARQVFSETSTNSSDHLFLGRIYMSAGKLDEAGRRFRRAVELGSGVPETWLTLVQYLVQTKRLDQAKVAVEAARKTLPPDRSAFTLAQCYSIVGGLTQAETSIQQVLKVSPRDSAALRFAVLLYLGQNRLDKLNDCLSKLETIADASADDKAWVNRTRVAVLLKTNRRSDRDQALGLVEQNLKTNPESVEDQLLKAAILAVRPGRLAESVKILEQLDGANRLEPSQRFPLAQLYLGDRNEEKYQSEMLKLLAVKAKDPQHLAHFVNYWIGCKQLDQADRWLAELKKAEPQGVAALELEAKLLDLRKRKPELLALLEGRGREVPDQIGAVADLLNRFGFAKEAEAAYKAFVAREPRQPERSLALAKFLTSQDRVPEAMDILKKAWSTCRPEQVATIALSIYDAPSAGDGDKRQVEAWVAEVARRRPEAVEFAAKLGAIWIRQGRLDEAEALYRQLLAANPGHAEALNNLAWLLVMREQPKTDEALQLIERALAAEGTNPRLMDTRAVALIRAGRLDQAIEQLSAALSQDTRQPSLPLHLAWALEAKGNREEARTEFRKAEELGLKAQSLDPYERATVRRLREELFPG